MNNKLPDEPMSLDTAIIHADEQAASLSGPCAVQHMQLANWLRELQERCKADSAVPVAWSARDVRNNELSLYSLIDDVNAALSENQYLEVTPLYTTPPAPVMPDEYVRDANGKMMLNGKCEPRIGFGSGWNACRKAMLQVPQQINQERVKSCLA